MPDSIIRFLSGVLLALVTCAAVAQVQSNQQLNADPTSSGASHGWLVLPSEADDGSVLIHVPPRRSTDAGQFRASEPGTLRVARHLASTPIAVSGWGDDLFLLMPASADRPGRVLALRAYPSPVGDYWSFEPRSRLAPVAVLPSGSDALSILGTRAGPVVLVRSAGEHRVLRRANGSWEDLDAPVGRGAGSNILVSDAGGGPALLVVSPDSELSLWTLSEDSWGSASQIGRSPSGPVQSIIGAARSGDRVILARRAGRAIELVAAGGGGSERIALVEDVGEALAVSFTGHRAPSFIAAWAVPGARAGAVELVEVSTATGQELHRGRASNTLPVSTTQFRILAGALIALMAVVLFVVLRPGPDRPITLQEGFSLAEPGRRLVATAIDLLIAAFIVSVIFSLPLLEVITLTSMIRPGANWMTTPAVLAIGFGLGVVGESITGRTLGKAATGCLVVRVSGASAGLGPVRAGLGRSILRNAIKWGLPPVAALALIDPSARHRGDAISGLAVVIPPAPKAEDRDSEA